MITRLKVLKKIANDLTTHPEAIEGVKPKQIVKLKSLEINNDEWNTIDILIKLLKPFFHATKTMSGQNYSTLSLSFVTRDLLKKFLNSNDANESKKETILKRTLSEALEYHLFTKISKEQNQAQQIAAFLDPSTYKYLKEEEKEEVEKEIVKYTIKIGEHNLHVLKQIIHLVKQTILKIKQQTNLNC